MSDFISTRPDGITVKIKVVPNSTQRAVTCDGNQVIIRITEPPVEGKANKAIIKYLGKILKVPPTSIQILNGEVSRQKTLFIPNITAELFLQKIT